MKIWAEQAKKDPKRIVFPESTEERTLKAIGMILKEGIAKPILIGDETEIMGKFQEYGVEVKKEDIEIIDPDKSDKLDQYCKEFAELRKDKGVTLEHVKEKMEESVYVKTASAKPVYLIDAGIVTDLAREPLYFRDSQMMKFEREDVKRIQLERKDETIACIKQEHDWRILEPVREKAKNYEIIDILRKLDSLKAEEFVTEKAGRLSE